MIPLKFGTFQNEDPAGPDFVKDIPVDLFEGLSSAIEQGQKNTFFGPGGGFSRLQTLRAVGQDIDEDVVGGSFLKGVFNTLEFAGIVDPVDQTPRKILSPEEATEQFGIEGELSFDKPINSSAAVFLRDEKKEEIARRLVSERVKGIGSNFAALGAEFLGELSDPLGVAFLLFPNIAVAKGGKFLTQSARSTAAAGAGEGALGTVGALGLGALAGEQTKSDFDAYTGAITVLFGAGFGAGARVGIEKVSKAVTGRFTSKTFQAEEAEVKEVIKATKRAPTEYRGVSPEADESAAKAALAQTINDEKITAPEDIIKVDKVKVTRVPEGQSGSETLHSVFGDTSTPAGLTKKLELLKRAKTDPKFKEQVLEFITRGDSADVKRFQTKTIDKDIDRAIKFTEQELRGETPNDTSIDDLIQVVATHIGKVEGGSVPAGIRDEIAEAFNSAGIPLGTFENFADNAGAVRRLLNTDLSDPNIVKKALRKILGTEGLDGPTIKAQALTRADSRAVNPPKERFYEDIPLETQRVESQDALDQTGNVNIEDYESLQSARKAGDSELEQSFRDSGFDDEQIAEIKRRTEEEYDAIDDERDADIDTLDCIDKNTP